MKPLVVRVVAIIAIMLVVVALAVSFMRMQEIPVLKISVSVTLDGDNPHVRVDSVKRETMSAMSAPREIPQVFPAVEAYIAVNGGVKGIKWAATLYKGEGNYELEVPFDKINENDVIMIRVRVVDEYGKRISNEERIFKKWGEIEE